MIQRPTNKRRLFQIGGRHPQDRLDLSPDAPHGANAGEDPTDQFDALSRNQKALAAAMFAPPVRLAEAGGWLEHTPLTSRPTTLAQVAAPSFAYWAEALHCSVRPHRKLWEHIAVMQALHTTGTLRKGARVLGLGVGDEPLPSYFAALGMQVVATDLPGAAERERLLKPHLVTAETFDAQVEVSNVDMRRLDDTTLRGFDAVWSCSVINALANVDEASDAVIYAMDTLRPGGLAVHMFDYAFADDRPLQAAGSLAFPQRFIHALADGLDGRKHKTAPLSFDLGEHPLDAYVDLEPFETDGAQAHLEQWAGIHPPHLKTIQGEVLSTSFALVVQARA